MAEEHKNQVFILMILFDEFIIFFNYLTSCIG